MPGDVNLRDPAGFSWPPKFEVGNKDVLHISNAPTVDATSFLRLIVATARDPVDAATSVFVLKNVARGTANIILLNSTGP